MEHYVSVNLISGNRTSNMMKLPLLPVLKEVIINAPEEKLDCWLLSNGYRDTTGQYIREECNFQWIDTILLDCDNKGNDTNLKRKFEQEYGAYDYIIWETASSTKECPKFRAIIMLDDKIPWINEPKKYTKQAIKECFSRWTDDNASWYFTPTKDKIATVRRNRGKPFESKKILDLIELRRRIDEQAASMEMLKQLRYRANEPRQFDENGWRNLPSVKYCLRGLLKGERDTSLHKACYAMKKCGYERMIHQFLDECAIPPYMRDKFKARYR